MKLNVKISLSILEAKHINNIYFLGIIMYYLTSNNVHTFTPVLTVCRPVSFFSLTYHT